jgi:nicotinate-nucleotide--dimethylbenzimidazole phosphoribosyltransferase
MMRTLEDMLNAIQPLDRALLQQARDRLDLMAIPRGSLGRLEEFAQRVAGIRNNLSPALGKKAIAVFAGDHGVAEEGVSAFARDVTAQMVYNFVRGGAGINVLARQAGASVVVVDIGVAIDLQPQEGLLIRKVAHGTRNMRRFPAMEKDEALKALLVGVHIAEDLASKEVTLIGTGDMGIANTTASSAITAVLTGRSVEEVTGRGTGVTDDMLRHKVKVIREAIDLHRPDPRNPMDVLAKLGGLEIAGIAGLIIGSAFHRIPVVVDGFISSAAALVAVSLKPAIREYLFAGHRSAEQGHRIVLEWLGLDPLLDLSMRLGEGTGAALGMFLIESGIRVLREVLTFEQAGVKKAVH